MIGFGNGFAGGRPRGGSGFIVSWFQTRGAWRTRRSRAPRPNSPVPSSSRLDGSGTGAVGAGSILTSPFPFDVGPNPKSSVSEYGDTGEPVIGGLNMSVWANRVLPGSKKANTLTNPGPTEATEPISSNVGHPVVVGHVKLSLSSTSNGAAWPLLLTLGKERSMVGFDGPALSPVTMLIVHDPTVPLNDTQVPAEQGVPNTVMVEAPLVSISSSESARAVLGATRTSKPNATTSANFVVFMVPPERSISREIEA